MYGHQDELDTGYSFGDNAGTFMDFAMLINGDPGGHGDNHCQARRLSQTLVSL
jgi:hypothetical protein